ncbi:MAG: carbohydrate-binding family 9-like protein [Planctomycetaceae bacterium]
MTHNSGFFRKLFQGRPHIAHAIAVAAMAALGASSTQAMADEKTVAERPTMTVKHCSDFKVNGKGDAAAWQTTEWVSLNRRPQAQHDYTARIKMLYSDTGVYVLFDGTDTKLTSTMQEDFADLWNEDVYECFFWTDETHPVYFEYEISPLGYELPILVPNMDGTFLGWRPWHYDGVRRIQKHVSATGGSVASMSEVEGWRAEVFIPNALLAPLKNVPPKPGTKWRANFYRMDYDGGGKSQWDWARVGPSFHEFKSFGTLVFE